MSFFPICDHRGLSRSKHDSDFSFSVQRFLHVMKAKRHPTFVPFDAPGAAHPLALSAPSRKVKVIVWRWRVGVSSLQLQKIETCFTEKLTQPHLTDRIQNHRRPIHLSQTAAEAGGGRGSLCPPKVNIGVWIWGCTVETY